MIIDHDNSTSDIQPLPAEERNNGMLCHLLSFLGLMGIPFGGIAGPLVMWLSKRDTSAFVDECGRESVNFQISLMLYMLPAGFLCLFLIGIPIVIGLLIIDLVCVIQASIAASEGRIYKYPMTIRLIS